MSNEIKKWIFTYTDDASYKPFKTKFVGTEEEFQLIRDQDKELFNANYTIITECEPTDDELKEYWNWH